MATYNIDKIALPSGDVCELKGCPTGGDTDQVLTKKSNTDYDVEWGIAGSKTTDISTAVVTLAESELAYTGSKQSVVIQSVTFDGNALRQYEDYIVVGDSSGTDVGDYVFSIVGIDKYSGRKVVNWSIDIPASNTLSDNDPDTIKMVAEAGSGRSYWSIGDKTAPISISAFANMAATSACAFIIGFDHNKDVEGTGITFQFGKTTDGTDIAFVDSGYGSSKTSGTWFDMKNSSSNSGGWKSSRMRYPLISNFKSALPSAWQSVIKTITKWTDNDGGGPNVSHFVTETSDDIFLLSEFEVQGVITHAYPQEQYSQVQYEYYSSGNSKVKYKHNATSTACYWWLRSPVLKYSASFCRASTDGTAASASAYYSYGFAPAFVVG